MPSIDHRTEKEKQTGFSFYVWDDLLAQKKHQAHHFYRFDTMDEAIKQYESLPKDMTTALGFHDHRTGYESDLIQRRMGESALVKDFLRSDSHRMDPSVHELVISLCEKLQVKWELEFMLGNSILIPREYGVEPLYSNSISDPYFDDKRLDYLIRDPYVNTRIPHERGPKHAIQEVYLTNTGKAGYLDNQPFFKMLRASKDGYLNEIRPQVSHFYVNYITRSGHFGGADVSPHMMRSLLARETYLAHQTEDDFIHWTYDTAALLSLARDLDQFAYDFDTYHYLDETQCLPDGSPDREGNVQQILEDLLSGNSHGYRAYLKEAMEDDRHSAWGEIARQVLAKLDAACPGKLSRSLDKLLRETKEGKDGIVSTKQTPEKSLKEERSDRT